MNLNSPAGFQMIFSVNRCLSPSAPAYSRRAKSLGPLSDRGVRLGVLSAFLLFAAIVRSSAAEVTETNGIQLPTWVESGAVFMGRIQFATNLVDEAPFTVRIIPDGATDWSVTNVLIPKGANHFDFTVTTRQANHHVNVTAVGTGVRFDATFIIRPKHLHWAISLFFGILLVGTVFWFLPCMVGASGGFRYLFIGEDGLASTSKTQATMWTMAAMFAYVSIAFVKWYSNDDSALDIPASLAIAMGLGFTTAVVAKGITVKQVQDGKIADRSTNPSQARTFTSFKYLVTTDGGRMDLGKLQTMGWTLVGLLFFAGRWWHTIRIPDVAQMTIPDLEAPLWVLMGLANGAYLGGKLVPSDRENSIDSAPQTAKPGDTITVSGTFTVMNSGSKIEILADGAVDPTWTAKRKDEHTIDVTIPSTLSTPRVVSLRLQITDVINTASRIAITQNALSLTIK